MSHSRLLDFDLESGGWPNLSHPTVPLERSETKNSSLEKSLTRDLRCVSHSSNVHDRH